MKRKQRIDMLVKELDREIGFSYEMLAHAAEILYYYGECMVEHSNAGSCESWKGGEASVNKEFVLDFVRANNKSPELLTLREEAINHYFYMQSYPAFKKAMPGDRENLKELMAQGLIHRSAEIWMEELLSRDSNGGILTCE